MYPTMLYLLTETLSYYNIVTPSNNNNNNSSSNRLFSSDESNAALIRWLFHTTLFPGIVLFMAIYLQNNTASPSSNASKWIHSCSSVLASAIAIYLTLMVLIECTVRVVLFQAGIGTAIDPSAIDNAYQQQEKHAAALDRCMERSLLQRDIGETETGAASTSVSRCCGNQQDSNHATSTSTAAATATSATILSGSYNNSCAICLEDFQVGDTVVSGRKDCCKSNVFHESCIKQARTTNRTRPEGRPLRERKHER
jgi:hypothetical protein